MTKLTENEAMCLHIFANGGSHKDVAARFGYANHYSSTQTMQRVYTKLRIGTKEDSKGKRTVLQQRNVEGDVVHQLSEIGKLLLEAREKLAEVCRAIH